MRRRNLLIGLGAAILLFLLAVGIGQHFAETRYRGRLIPVNDQVGLLIGGIDIQLLRGRVHLSDISIPDTFALADEASVGSIDVSGIQWMQLLRHGKFRVKEVSVNDLDAKLDLSRLDRDSIQRGGPQRFITASIAKLGLKFDEQMNPALVSIDAGPISYAPSEGNYDFEVRGIHADKPYELITLDSFVMTPRYPKFEFGYRNGRRVGSVELAVPDVHLHGFDLQRLFRDSVIELRNVEFITPVVIVFTDKRLPVDTERYVALPQESLLNAPRGVMIDSVMVRDMHLRYETINPSTMNQGYIEFDHSFLAIGNVTNIPALIQENSVMTLDLFSKFMGVADLNAHFQFYLDREDYFFRWNGKLEAMKIKELDKFTIPVANMNIVEGNCESVEFQVAADIDSAHGTLDFAYEDLKIAAVDPETHRHRKLLSTVANLFIVKQDNIEGRSDFRQGTIAYRHETNRGFEHYIWTSLQTGFLYTILNEDLADRIQQNKTGRKEEADNFAPEDP